MARFELDEFAALRAGLARIAAGDRLSGDPFQQELALTAHRLGEMAAQDGDTDEAVRHLERARDTGDAAFGPRATRLPARPTG